MSTTPRMLAYLRIVHQLSKHLASLAESLCVNAHLKVTADQDNVALRGGLLTLGGTLRPTECS